jgi:hypothetical protein
MIDNARFLTKYVRDNRTAELFELEDRSGYLVRMIHDRVIKEDRVIKGKSIRYIVDTCENWVEGIIDPRI